MNFGDLSILCRKQIRRHPPHEIGRRYLQSTALKRIALIEMNFLLSLLNNLNYRTFFFYIIPISTLTIYLIKFNQILKDDVLGGTMTMIFQIISIYLIGGIWLIMYTGYKVIIVENSKQKDLNSILSSEHLNFNNFQRAIFFGWIVGILNLIFEIY